MKEEIKVWKCKYLHFFLEERRGEEGRKVDYVAVNSKQMMA